MIQDAVRLLLEARREDVERETVGRTDVVREPLEVCSAASSYFISGAWLRASQHLP